MAYYYIFKALHIIFMVSYFAGIFYLVRLFVYYKDTDGFSGPKKDILRSQYVFMIFRLWTIIVLPAGMLMVVFGLCMLFVNPGLLQASWFHLKFLFLLFLLGFHFWCWKKVLEIKKLEGKALMNSTIVLRQMNEVATFLLFLVVFTAVLKSQLLFYWREFLSGFLVLVLVIISVVKWVSRKKK
ncbi:MAG: CopD family protein [Bergeyella sp.]|nr:CopD family protein [Bergeyella sp.]